MGESKVLKQFFEEQHRKWKKSALRAAGGKYIHLDLRKCFRRERSGGQDVSGSTNGENTKTK
jgi:hypothetical protein